MELKNEGRVAVVATSAHTISCAIGSCEIRVGFGDSLPPAFGKWSDAVQVISREPGKDLAFVEVEIPDGAETRAARFASPECGQAGVEPVVSIGWPDLRKRSKWGVKPPQNHKDQVKRFSDGFFLLWLEGYQMRSELDLMMERLQVVFHNADVLPGSSGGPLLNQNGEVVGLNTMVVSGAAVPESHPYCARRHLHQPGLCAHVAIASGELIKEFERIYSSRIAIADCRRAPKNARDEMSQDSRPAP